MAYCLRDLPPPCQLLIEQMRAHWSDIQELKAAGGTPSARALKAFRVHVHLVGGVITVRALVRHRDFVRRYGYWRCEQCRVPRAEGGCTCRARCVNMSAVSFGVSAACRYLP